MAQLAESEPLLQHLIREKQNIWTENAHLPVEERQHLWNCRQAELGSRIGINCQSNNAQRPANAQALPPSMNRGQDLSVQSAPAAVSMSRTPSTFAVADDQFTLGSHYAPRGVDWYDNASPNYILDSTAHDSQLYQAGLQTSSSAQFADLNVYDDPSDYILTMADHSNLNSLQNDSLFSQSWSTSDNMLSPRTPSSTELCSDSTLTSQLSRQSSLAASSSQDAFDMARNQSNVSSFSNHCFDGQLSPITLSSSEKANGSPIAFSESQRSHLLSHCDFTGDEAYASRQFPYLLSAQSSFPLNDSMGEMDRSLSSESNGSQSSLSNRAHRRRQEQIAQAARPIAPKSDSEAVTSLQQQPEHKMVRIESHDGTSKHVAAIKRAPYVRPQHPKIMCKHCNDHPEGFRGEHELRRHTERVHARMRKVWVTVDKSEDKSFLSKCKACRIGKRYGVYYNAAAHLRRAHFAPRKRGRKCKGDEKRGGKAGGDWPSMDWLKQHGWLQEVEELVPEHASDKITEDSDESEPISPAVDTVLQQMLNAQHSVDYMFAHSQPYGYFSNGAWFDQ
ncbi:MAG: hypothetical protein Q9157_005241 [Trypethelium eluteriae]